MCACTLSTMRLYCGRMFADDVGREQRVAAIPQVVAEAADAVHVGIFVQEPVPDAAEHIADLDEQFGKQVGIIEGHDGEIFVADEILHDFEDAVADAADRLHARRHMAAKRVVILTSPKG